MDNYYSLCTSGDPNVAVHWKCIVKCATVTVWSSEQVNHSSVIKILTSSLCRNPHLQVSELLKSSGVNNL